MNKIGFISYDQGDNAQNKRPVYLHLQRVSNMQDVLSSFNDRLYTIRRHIFVKIKVPPGIPSEENAIVLTKELFSLWLRTTAPMKSHGPPCGRPGGTSMPRCSGTAPWVKPLTGNGPLKVLIGDIRLIGRIEQYNPGRVLQPPRHVIRLQQTVWLTV